jgi:hypothetical protein
MGSTSEKFLIAMLWSIFYWLGHSTSTAEVSGQDDRVRSLIHTIYKTIMRKGSLREIIIKPYGINYCENKFPDLGNQFYIILEIIHKVLICLLFQN